MTGGAAGAAGTGGVTVPCGTTTLYETAVAYCEGLGNVVIPIDSGDICHYPDSGNCMIEQVLSGTCRPTLSHCARYGYTVIEGTCSLGKVVACRFPDGSVCWDGDFATGACGPCVPGRDSKCAGVWLATNATTYTDDAVLTLTLHNDTNANVYLRPCGGRGLEQLLTDGTWQTVAEESMCDPTSVHWQTVSANATSQESFPLASTVHAFYRTCKVVGYGCDTSVPLTQAQCQRTEKICTQSFSHLVTP